MKITHYEATVQIAKSFKLDLEEYWEKGVKPHLGERMMSKLACVRYDPFFKTACAQEMSGSMPSQAFMTNLPTMASESQSVYNFWRAGKKVFSISEPLSRLLMDTDLKVPKFFLKLPFPCIYLRFESQAVMDLYCHYDKSWLALDGIYIFDLDESFLEGQEHSEPGALLPSEFLKIIKDESYKPEKLINRPVRKIVGISKGEASSNVNFVNLKWDIEDDRIIDEKYCEHIPGVNVSGLYQLGQLCKLALASVAYINCSGADVKQHKSPALIEQERIAKAQGCKVVPKRWFNRARSLSKMGIYRVGGSIQIPAGSGGEAPKLQETSKHGCRTFSYRHQVRSHYRLYWMLEKNMSEEDKKAVKLEKDGKFGVIKWIKAFWKGPEFSEVVTRPYKVDVKK